MTLDRFKGRAWNVQAGVPFPDQVSDTPPGTRHVLATRGK